MKAINIFMFEEKDGEKKKRIHLKMTLHVPPIVWPIFVSSQLSIHGFL